MLVSELKDDEKYIIHYDYTICHFLWADRLEKWTPE